LLIGERSQAKAKMMD